MYGLSGTTNFNAMAMEPLGHVAGVASSMLGCYTTAVGAILGWIIGQSFDGTVRPLEIGLSVVAAMALLTVLVTERGRLFVPHAPHAPPAEAPPDQPTEVPPGAPPESPPAGPQEIPPDAPPEVRL